MATNSDTDTIYLIDPLTCETIDAIAHPDGGGFGGAGLDMDAAGNLWTVGQNSGNAYLIESGLPNFSRRALADGQPDRAGTVAPGRRRPTSTSPSTRPGSTPAPTGRSSSSRRTTPTTRSPRSR